MRKAILLAFAISTAAACAPKNVPPPPVVTTPKFPEFMAPTVPAALAGSPAAGQEARGWQFLQAGDVKAAERELAITLKAAPTFYPAETALGYVDLAKKDAKTALQNFDLVLERYPSYVPALVGKAQALLALNREADAIAAYEAAIAADPGLVDMRRSVEVLKFKVAEQNLAAARQAARTGRLDEAIHLYTDALGSSPESPFLYRELAAVERQKGDAEAALAHFRRAAALDPADARSHEQIGEILEGRGEFDAAVKAYEEAIAIEPNKSIEQRLEAAKERAAISRLPAEYREIDQAEQITRGDLAALIGIRLAPVLQDSARGAGVVITDVRTHWAAPWIMAVAHAGVMDPFPNHTFQPRTIVRRIDLAQAVARLLPRTGKSPAQVRGWEAARLKFTDLSAGHLSYPAASAAVASGVMTTGQDAAFQPSRVVTGREASEAIDRLAALAGLSTSSPRGAAPASESRVDRREDGSP